jgi:hypothetical protein
MRRCARLADDVGDRQPFRVTRGGGDHPPEDQLFRAPAKLMSARVTAPSLWVVTATATVRVPVSSAKSGW